MWRQSQSFSRFYVDRRRWDRNLFTHFPSGAAVIVIFPSLHIWEAYLSLVSPHAPSLATTLSQLTRLYLFFTRDLFFCSLWLCWLNAFLFTRVPDKEFLLKYKSPTPNHSLFVLEYEWNIYWSWENSKREVDVPDGQWSYWCWSRNYRNKPWCLHFSAVLQNSRWGMCIMTYYNVCLRYFNYNLCLFKIFQCRTQEQYKVILFP